MIKLIWETTITDVRERELVVGGRKDTAGNAEMFVESVGWYIYIGNVAIFAGKEKPEFAAGDRIKLTLEKKETDRAN